MPPHFVVSLHNSSKKAGIVASTFPEFLNKCILKFGLKKNQDIIVCLDDDTEVDDEYFEVLSPGTHLYLSTKDTRDPGISDNSSIHKLAAFLHACLEKQPSIHQKIVDCLQEPLTYDKATSMLKLLATTAVTDVSLSSRNDHEEWFKGLDTKFKTKENVMRNSAETRMRSYLYRAQHDLLANVPSDDTHIKSALAYFKQQLSSSRYNSSYFDRSADTGGRLCDSRGLFQCEGPYNCCSCPTLHFINPYESRETRIIFSTWNLDHVIEKSRTILPALKTALNSRKASCVNLQYFHSLLFNHLDKSVSEGNLKLVHIACHDKKPHSLNLKQEKVYVEDLVDGKRSKDVGGRKRSKKINVSDDMVDGKKLSRTKPALNHSHSKRKRPNWDSHYFTRSKKVSI